jgi:hypothetical protein
MLAMGLNPPPTWDMEFRRFASRNGFEPYSPQRRARQELILAAYERRLVMDSLPDAIVYQFPRPAEAEVINIEVLRLRRDRLDG